MPLGLQGPVLRSKALWVIDNLVNQKLAVNILEKYGHSVEIVENGSLAVDAFKARVAQNKPFDIILVSSLRFTFGRWGDFMPWVDGRIDAVHGRNGGDGTYPVV